VEVIRGEMFSAGYGFVVDYLAEILRHMRNEDFSNRYKDLFTLSVDISTRDRDGVNKTFSGLMKLLFPTAGATEEEVAEILTLALEGRKRVKDQLKRIDSTYPDTDFSYLRRDGVKVSAATLEETEYPDLYTLRRKSGGDEAAPLSAPEKAMVPVVRAPGVPVVEIPAPPQPGHRTFAENQKGVSFETLFWPWLANASKIVITDPYISVFHQTRNLMEFIEMVALRKSADQRVELHLVTSADEFNPEKQAANLAAIVQAAAGADIAFTWEIDRSKSMHARHIVTDTGWKIGLDRGLDIFQKFELNDAFSLPNRLQKFRPLKSFEVTYIRLEGANTK
jgi:ATP-dependent Lon protease